MFFEVPYTHSGHDTMITHARELADILLGTSKNQFRWLFEVPCGTCLLGKGL